MNEYIDAHYKNFRFWCQKVLPLTYDESLSYYELLCKVVKQLNTIGDTENELVKAFNDLLDYVNNYFDDLDIEPYIDAELERMVEDGEIDSIVQRLMSVDYVTPLMFDGVGDGVADDTQAVQAAFDDGRAVCFPLDKVFLITDSIIIKDVTRLSAVAFAKANDRHSGKINIVCNFPTEKPIFIIRTQAFTFENIMIECLNRNEGLAHRYLTCFKSDLSVADVDFNIVNCFIDNAGVVMDITGRGFLCIDSVIARCEQFLNAKWGGTDTGGNYHDATTGQRAYIVRGNRFHSIRETEYFIDVESGNVYGFEFCDNNFDRGYSKFLHATDDCDNWLISNNHFNGMRGSDTGVCLMEFDGSLTNSVISNNVVSQVGTGADSRLQGLVYFKTNGEKVENVVFSNNVINFVRNGSLVIANGVSFDGVIIEGNAIGESKDITSNRAFLRGANIDVANSSIVNNTICKFNNSDPEDTYSFFAAAGSGECYMSNCKIIGNCIGSNVGTQISNIPNEYCIFDWTLAVSE